MPFQSCVMLWPGLSGQLTVHPLMGALPAVTVTSPWNPPDQELVVRYVAVHAAPDGGRVGRLVGGAVDGGTVDGVVGGAVGGVVGGVVPPPGSNGHVLRYMEMFELSIRGHRNCV